MTWKPVPGHIMTKWAAEVEIEINNCLIYDPVLEKPGAERIKKRIENCSKKLREEKAY
jgi:hypothetical protein